MTFRTSLGPAFLKGVIFLEHQKEDVICPNLPKLTKALVNSRNVLASAFKAASGPFIEPFFFLMLAKTCLSSCWAYSASL